MATTKAVVTQQHLTDIADAIRTKGGTTDTLMPSEMAAAIEAIPTGGGEPGNGLPIGCPRIDKISMSTERDEQYFVVHIVGEDPVTYTMYVNSEVSSDNVRIAEVIVSDDGSVAETDNVSVGRPASIVLSGIGFHVIRLTAVRGRKITVIGQNYVGKSFVASFGPLILGSVDGVARVIGTKHFDGTFGYANKILSIKACSVFETRGIYFDYAFISGCYVIEELILNGTCAPNAFNNSWNQFLYLNKIDMSNLDISNLTYFALPSVCSCVRMPDDANKGPRISFYASGNYDKSSILSILNSLYDHISAGTGSTPNLTIGTTNLAKLTDAEKQIATDKGWILA